MEMKTGIRNVVVGDAVEWLRNNRLSGSSLVASIPDFSEFPGKTLDEWTVWFQEAALATLSATPPEGVTIFYQTDIKVEGSWIDKGFLCQQAAQRAGRKLLWHKIACRARPGQATFGRPGFGHLLCFSESVRAVVGESTADVLPELGDKTWERGMGFDVCRVVAHFIKDRVGSQVVVNPFCGHGSMLAVANAVGLDAVGIERSPKRAARAQLLVAELTRGKFEAAPAENLANADIDAGR
jgi:hypothetical protein